MKTHPANTPSALMLAALALHGSGLAQIRTDSSLGQSAQTLPGPAYVIPQSLGRLAGSNLFHSFQTFNINTGESARFTTSSTGIGNVISRVTGGASSQINGSLSLAGAATAPNFYFINPAGVTFGAGGAIDVPAAFYVSTANYLKFANGDRFYADLSKTSVLSSVAAEAFGFLGTSRATIAIKEGAIVKTMPLQPLHIAGGDIDINKGSVTTQGGDIHVVALGQKAQEIGFTDATPGAEGHLAVLNGGKISSSTYAKGDAGSIKISAGTITLDGQGKVTGIASQAISNAGNAGSLDIMASGVLSVLNGGQISSSTYASGNAGTVKVNAGAIAIDSQGGGWTGIASNAVGNAANGGKTGNVGSLDITASGALSIVNGGVISSSTFSSGNAGTVKVSAGSIAIDGRGGASIASDANGNAANGGQTGDAGSLDITVRGVLSIVNGGQISSRTYASGKAGTVKVSAGALAIDGQGGSWTGIASNASGNAVNGGQTGDAGSLDITVSGLLSMLNGGAISSSTYASGKAGTVKVSAGAISIEGQGKVTGIASQASGNTVNGGKTGDAGSLDITARGALSIVNGGIISSSTSSLGKAGTVKVSAGAITLDSQGGEWTGISSQANSNAANGGQSGDAGSLDITARSALSILNGGVISSSTYTSGKAGTIKVSAGAITIDRQGGDWFTGIDSQASGKAANGGQTGDAGGLDITVSGLLSIVNGGAISSSAFSSGNAGTIKVSAGAITIDRQGGKATGIDSNAMGNADNTGTTGNAGSLDITASGALSIVNGGVISSSTFSAGKAGTVKVSAGAIRIDGQGGEWTGIASQAAGDAGNAGQTGDAGSLDITASGALSIVNGGAISSTTFSSGKAGTVKVNANSVVVDGESSSINAQAGIGSSGQTGSVSVTALDRITLSSQGMISIQNDATLTQTGTLVPTLLTVSAPVITLHEAQISAASTGNLPAGGLKIKSSQLFLEPGSRIATSSNLGHGGPIDIAAAMLWLNHSQITTSVAGKNGNGGNISIAADVLAMNTGFIQANTAAANASGGLVSITASNLISSGSSLKLGGNTPYPFQSGVFGFNVVQAAAPTGVSGLINISSPVLDVSGSLRGLDAQLPSDGGLGRNPCQTSGGSSLVQTGRGGLPSSGRGLLHGDSLAAVPDAMPVLSLSGHPNAAPVGLPTRSCP